MNESTQSCLVIPDLHQNIRWAESILAKEANEVEHVVFLGDYFDPKVSSAANVTDTAIFVSELRERYRPAFTFLVGNHDLPYLYDLQKRDGPTNAFRNPYSNGAYDSSASNSIESHLSAEFTASLEPFTFAHGRLLSHAGLHVEHLGLDMPLTREGIETLHGILQKEVRSLSDKPHPALAAIGSARGGVAPTGGLTWLDWQVEFKDTFPWPQIVGHTLVPAPSNIGRSWDIDTRDGHYAILKGEKIDLKSLPKES